MKMRDMLSPRIALAAGLSMMLWSVALAAVIGAWQAPWLVGCGLFGFGIGTIVSGGDD